MTSSRPLTGPAVWTRARQADTPVLHVQLSTGPGGRYQHDEQAPRITSLFTVTCHELAQQVLTDNVRFSSTANAMTIGPVMGRTILEMDPPEHQRHRAWSPRPSAPAS